LESNQISINLVVECHYKLSDKLMKENGAIKVLELPFGLAPRGLKWTENPNITYVKFDL
jgi:hypothetical protein